jgi:hypothetical protein
MVHEIVLHDCFIGAPLVFKEVHGRSATCSLCSP